MDLEADPKALYVNQYGEPGDRQNRMKEQREVLFHPHKGSSLGSPSMGFAPLCFRLPIDRSPAKNLLRRNGFAESTMFYHPIKGDKNGFGDRKKHSQHWYCFKG